MGHVEWDLLGDDNRHRSDEPAWPLPPSYGAALPTTPARIEDVLFLDLASCAGDLTVERDRMGPIPFYRDIAEVALPPGPLPANAFRHAHHRALVKVWNRLQRPDDAVPPRTAFDVMDLFRSVAHLTLVQEIEDGSDFHYRVQGGAIVTRHAREMTGKRMSDYGGGPALLHGPLYRRVIDERRPVYCEHSILSGQGTFLQRWSRICVPFLGPNDGAHFVLNAAVNVDFQIVGG